MQTIEQSLALAKSQLCRASSHLAPREHAFEAEILLAHTLGKTRVFLHAYPHTELSAEQIQQYLSYIARRAAKEPIAYVIGKREFYSLDLTVNQHTLIPRPETELLVETILALGKNKKTWRVADLGTGCGAIALALASHRPEWQVIATDAHAQALAIAKNNAARLQLCNVTFNLGDWCAALAKPSFDLIVSNPPYLSQTEWAQDGEGLYYEPYTALVAGEDGLADARAIIQSAKGHLSLGAYLVLEHGWTQGEAVRRLLHEHDYTSIKTIIDLSGKERVTLGQYSRIQEE